MASLTIRGEKRYIKHMYIHLRKEHPSTRNRMRANGIKRGIGMKHKKKR